MYAHVMTTVLVLTSATVGVAWCRFIPPGHGEGELKQLRGDIYFSEYADLVANTGACSCAAACCCCCAALRLA